MHTDPELLSLFALGEDVGDEVDRVHVRTCPVCARDLADLLRVVHLARSADAETVVATPSPAVWARMRDDLALGSAIEPPARPSGDAWPDTYQPSTAGRTAGTAATRPASTPARRSLLAVIKTAIAGTPRAFEDEATLHARLTPVESSWSRASGEAMLGTDEHGRRLLQVTLQGDLPASGVRQAWLVHRDDPGLRQSLGILDGPYGLWTVEHAIDLDAYAILDISQQATGETAYSGQTVVRGELTLVG